MIPFKEVAMLTSGLLARKGAAVPASLGLSPFPQAAPAQPAAPQPAPPAPLRASNVAPTPPSPRVESWPPLPFPARPVQRPTPEAKAPEAKAPEAKAPEATSKDVPPAAPAELPTCNGVDCPPTDGKLAKVSLRLDPERHLKLRLAAAHQRRSGQQILLAALDAYVDGIAAEVAGGDCACLKRNSGA